jgi:hypothetical protein
MPRTFTAEQRANLREELRETLESVRVQDLRELAHTWGWPLKGTAKADLTEQMIGYLGDAARMAAGFARLPAVEQEALIWVTVMENGQVEERLREVLRLAGGQSLPVEEVSAMLQDLLAHGLLFPTPTGAWHMPVAYLEWLPETASPSLAHSGALQAIPVASMEDVSREVERLLEKIEKDRPEVVAQDEDGPAGRLKPQDSTIQPREGLLARSVWAHWSYGSGEDYDRARFILELMVSQGLCRVVDVPKGRLVPWPASLATWQDLSPVEQRAGMANAWVLHYQKLSSAGGQPLGFNELDMALRGASRVSLHSRAGWGARRMLLELIESEARAWLLSAVNLLKRDRWYDFTHFCELIFTMQRDLLLSRYPGQSWEWHRGGEAIFARAMDFDTWMLTYGSLVQAWFAGPARWFGLVQIASERGRLVAFQRPSTLPSRESGVLPANVLQFQPDGEIRLRNLWQASPLRPLIRRMAVEERRDRETTTYRLDAATFRATLQSGTNAEQVIEAFAKAGTPLPKETGERLRRWQTNAGRYLIYDDLAVIEFADDIAVAEILATTSLRHGNAYAISERCLVVLDAGKVPGLIAELRRKGYSPRVLSEPAGAGQEANAPATVEGSGR